MSYTDTGNPQGDNRIPCCPFYIYPSIVAVVQTGFIIYVNIDIIYMLALTYEIHNYGYFQ